MSRAGSPVDVQFIGIGAIGLPMASCIARGGHRVTAVDPDAGRRSLAEREGLATRDTYMASELTIIMVATTSQLSEVIDGPDGVFAVLPVGAVCVVMSTVGPDAVRAAAESASRHGVHLVDAPVTGGVGRAESGALTIFASGAPAVLRQVDDVLVSMGSIRLCGREIGVGQNVKLVNQHLAAVHLVAAAEALTFAESLGLDSSTVLRAVVDGAGGSFMLGDRGPRMVEEQRSTTRSTALDIFVKDSELVLDAAARAGFDAPLIAAAHDVFDRASRHGLGRADDSCVRDVYINRFESEIS